MSEQTSLTGSLRIINPTQTVGSNNFKKRICILDTDGQYTQPIQIEFQKDYCSLLDNYREGDRVKISYNIRGRETTNGRGETLFYNTIVAWKIERV